MGLSEAKRALQWNVVMEAITAAGVDDDIIKMVEAARDASTLIHGLTGMLLGGADKQAAKNYVKFEMVGLIAPFERAYVELVRADGKTSHELRDLLRRRLEHVRALLSEGTPTDGQRQGMIEGIDEDLAKESPSPTKVEVVSGRVDGVVVCQPGAKQFVDEASAAPDPVVAEAIRRWPEREYYILSLKWTRRDDCITWWGPDNSGYTWLLEQAGRYTEADVKARASYLNNGESTLAIPCDVVEQFASRVVLHGASHRLLTAAFGKSTALVGSSVDDVDHEGRDHCPECERPYGSPGPSRIVHYDGAALLEAADRLKESP